jgi:hypothetical protein
LRFGSASSNSLATNGEITSANNNHAELRPLLGAATPTTIDNITHEKNGPHHFDVSAFRIEFVRARPGCFPAVLQTRFLVALPRLEDLLLPAKHLFVAANGGKLPLLGGSMRSNGTASVLNSAQDLASIPTARAASLALLSRAFKALAYP